MIKQEWSRLFFGSIRIKDWLHMLRLTFLGMMHASGELPRPQEFLVVLTVASLYLAHGYGVNDCFDRHYDTRLKKSAFRKNLVALYVVLLVNLVLSFLCLNPLVVGLVFFGGFLGFLYSAPPLRLKRKIFFNIPLNSMGFALLFLIGSVSAQGKITLSAAMVMFFFAFIFVPLQLIHFVAHADEDRADGIPTLYNRYGPQVTTYVVCGSLVLIVIWPLVSFLPVTQAYPLFFSSVLFSVALFLIFRRFLPSGASDQKIRAGVRLAFRALTAVFGLVAAAIFYFQ